jgi:membrane protein DedA with SNARE-associated domain
MDIKAPEEATKPARQPNMLWQVGALVLVIVVSVLAFVYRDQLVRFSSYGYLGVFVVSVIGNATVVLPLPSLVATFVTGGVLNPLAVGIVSGAGMAIGELSGYLAGYGGGAIVRVEDRERYTRLESWMRRYGSWTLLVLSIIPTPLFDLAGIAAGTLHYPVWRFLALCFVGKTIKGIALALAGAQSVEWVDWLSRLPVIHR